MKHFVYRLFLTPVLVSLIIAILAVLILVLSAKGDYVIAPYNAPVQSQKAQSYNVAPPHAKVAEIGQNTRKSPIPKVFSQQEVDEMTENTFHPTILRKLIKCESQNTNVARMDSNGLISFGLLQFNGTATWNQFSKLAGVSSSPMNPEAAIKVADYMISTGKLSRWTCAKLTGLL